VAQTRKKRRRKHRGTPAGTIERHGRTSKTHAGGSSGSSGASKTSARDRRLERMNKPPTWSGAIQRAGIASLLFVVLVVLIFKQNVGAAVALGAFLLIFYVPAGYYMDLFLYRRRMQKLGRPDETRRRRDA
jgi:hypothetical protein